MGTWDIIQNLVCLIILILMVGNLLSRAKSAAERSIKEQLDPSSEKEEARPSVAIYIEKVIHPAGDVFIMTDMRSGQFVGQGNTPKDLENVLNAKFAGKTVFIRYQDGWEYEFLGGK